MEPKEKAIALCRVSSDEQLKNHSLSKQEEAVQKVAERRNLEIVRIWSGSFSSKSGKNLYRKDLQEALKFCKENKQVKYLIVDEPDRFMRSSDEAGWYIVEFRKLGVSILFSDEKYNGGTSSNKLWLNLAINMGEASNEERARKTKSGHEKAIRDGRYPFIPKFGYRKGLVPGIADIDPVIGPLLKTQLERIADGLNPSVALQDFNQSVELAGLKKASLKMDKWRRYCTDPYYCGIIEMHKIVDETNPNGAHEKLITKETHDRIVAAFDGKPKNQRGPNPHGNPYYPFDKIITHIDCPHTKRQYDTLVGVTIRNGRGKPYPKYRCRGCDKYLLTRDEAREAISQMASSVELSESGLAALRDALEIVMDQEQGDIQARIVQLNSQKARAKKDSEKYMDSYVKETSGPMRDALKKKFEEIEARIKSYENEINKLGDFDAIELRAFVGFALDFVNNFAKNILDLSPENTLLCKQLVFPDGFFVDDNKNVYTRTISPIYRVKTTKKDSSESSYSLVVRMKRL